MRPRHPDDPAAAPGYPGTPAYAPDPRWARDRAVRALRRAAADHGRAPRSRACEHVYDAPGRIEFDLDGQQLSLTAFNGATPGSLFVLFTDATSGVTTYAANRSLTVDAAGRRRHGACWTSTGPRTCPSAPTRRFATCRLPPGGEPPARRRRGGREEAGRGGSEPGPRTPEAGRRTGPPGVRGIRASGRSATGDLRGLVRSGLLAALLALFFALFLPPFLALLRALLAALSCPVHSARPNSCGGSSCPPSSPWRSLSSPWRCPCRSSPPRRPLRRGCRSGPWPPGRCPYPVLSSKNSPRCAASERARAACGLQTGVWGL